MQEDCIHITSPIYLGLVISRSRHDPAENLHFLRQLRCQFILAFVSLLNLISLLGTVMEPPPLSVQVLEEVPVVLGQEVLCSDGE